MRIAPAIILTEEQRERLQTCARSRRLPRRLVERAEMILLASEGWQNKAIALTLRRGRRVVARWRQRFIESGLAGIEKDAPRPGRKPKLSAARVQEIVRQTTQKTPPHATHWSTRSMARAAGVSEATVRRIWRAHGLKPHRVRSFKLSNDPQFAEKLEAIVGLYLNPPEHALVLSLDEKSQIQALDRTQPGLPLKRGRGQTMTLDYKRHGTTTLFAALNTLDGRVIGTCMSQHRHQEWLRFLRLIDAQTPADREVHLIVDNYTTHKHPQVKRWLGRHRRFHLHFTPTSASWLNMVERFFRDLTQHRLRRAVFHSVADLESALRAHIDQHNQNPKPFIWTAKATDILEKVKRGKAVLNKIASV
jgi:transposase